MANRPSFRKFEFHQDAHPYGECVGCRRKFVHDKSIKIAPRIQCKQQFDDHECKDDGGKIVPRGERSAI